MTAFRVSAAAINVILNDPRAFFSQVDHLTIQKTR
jgi:hypothetical protein